MQFPSGLLNKRVSVRLDIVIPDKQGRPTFLAMEGEVREASPEGDLLIDEAPNAAVGTPRRLTFLRATRWISVSEEGEVQPASALDLTYVTGSRRRQ